MKSNALRALAIMSLVLIPVRVLAADATPAPAAAAAPSAAALAAASRLIVEVGARADLDAMVPSMLTQLEAQILQSRPEAKDAVREVVFALAPEFGKTEQGVLDALANSLAARMSEQDLVATSAFFDSPAGKAWLKAQPFMVRDMTQLTRTWREKLSVDMLARAREELKKKGFDL